MIPLFSGLFGQRRDNPCVADGKERMETTRDNCFSFISAHYHQRDEIYLDAQGVELVGEVEDGQDLLAGEVAHIGVAVHDIFFGDLIQPDLL